MSSAVVSVHGLKTRYIHFKRICFGLWIKERVIFMCSALVSVNRLKNDEHLCVARLFRLKQFKAWV